MGYASKFRLVVFMLWLEFIMLLISFLVYKFKLFPKVTLNCNRYILEVILKLKKAILKERISLIEPN
jgi:hypothetical protein